MNIDNSNKAKAGANSTMSMKDQLEYLKASQLIKAYRLQFQLLSKKLNECY